MKWNGNAMEIFVNLNSLNPQFMIFFTYFPTPVTRNACYSFHIETHLDMEIKVLEPSEQK